MYSKLRLHQGGCAMLEKISTKTMALLPDRSYIAFAGLQERNICQKMCWA